ncbi:MAG: DUF192 domain-containing protein [Candidatus Doudnabacteria bacterium]|nr:DUF192 domain-containing protein [Candidatus Doudnabacteria bacterium]
MKKFLMLGLVISLIAVACNNKSVLKTDRVVQIKQNKLTVQLADTPEKRTAGLSGVPSIGETEGMLFLFSEPQTPSFWMKDMKFGIDFIWINGNRIVGITDNIKPEPGVPDANLVRYAPQAKADKVLEVNAGWTIRHDVNTGDTLTISEP